MTHIIKNYNELARSKSREDALSIVEAGLGSVNTKKVIDQCITVSQSTLIVNGSRFNISDFDRVVVVGFGKVSCDAAMALEEKLGDLIKRGVVIDVKNKQCSIVDSYAGTHPKPSLENVVATKELVDLAREVTEKDLVIVIVSGGGSSLLCWPENERDQSERLYELFLQSGGNIEDLNIVRKHLSGLKGGGLAKELFPATVIGLVFSDVPGGDMSQVASGPTFFDTSTIQDAKDVLSKYNISLEQFTFNETPKNKEFFEKVHNFLVVSNEVALKAMKAKAQDLGYVSNIVSPIIAGDSDEVRKQFMSTLKDTTVSVGGGEIKLVVPADINGSGGRNTHFALCCLPRISTSDVIVAIASDGIDNSQVAGAIIDSETIVTARKKGLDPEEFLKKFNSYDFFKETGDSIVTGSTGSNVSDLIMFLRK